MLGRLKRHHYFNSAIIFMSLLSWIIIVNYPILAANLIYPEQPYFYIINEKIHSFRDFLQVYTHPAMLNIYFIQFFRPSGHFLMYQLLIPFLGWHNTRGLLIVNFLFLAATGYVLLKVYEFFFPRLKLGGYIAFSIYLMHPALMLSRFIAMHFEFAYIFFIMSSLYCFLIFCKNNTFTEKKLNQFSYFIYSLLLYIVAATFKEPAIMLAPVLFLYLIIHKKPKLNFHYFFISICIISISMLLAYYLTLQWPNMRYSLHERSIMHSCVLLLKILGGWSFEPIPQHPGFSWCECQFPWSIQFLLSSFLLLCMSAFIFSKNTLFQFKIPLLFLALTSLIFFMLPVMWSMGFPWHLSPTILFLSLLIGYIIDSCFLEGRKKERVIGVFIICIILIAGIHGTYTNIKRWEHLQIELTLNRNALSNPPALRDKLNKESVLVVENSLTGNEYKVGDSTYPISELGNLDYKGIQNIQKRSFMKYESLYNGTLFSWVYQIPDLHEQVYTFRVEDLSNIPIQIIYLWLQHFDNLYCVGPDKNLTWQDKTALFKKNLVQEKTKRALSITHYHLYREMTLNGLFLYSKKLLLPIPELCQLECDQNPDCKGTAYINQKEQQDYQIRCNYYGALDSLNPGADPGCVSFVK